MSLRQDDIEPVGSSGGRPAEPDSGELAVQSQVGVRIRELRIACGMTAVDLVRRAGISQGQLSKIESGKATISIKNLSRLCAVLDRPLSYLFQREQEIPKVLGTLTTVEGPENTAIQWFSAEVRRRTEARISLIPLWASQLGQPRDQMEQLSQGVIDVFIEELCHYQRFVPGFDMLGLPYLFRSTEHQQAYLSSAGFARKLQEPLLSHHIRFLNPGWNWLRGIERVIISGQPIVSPQDLRGLRVRIFDSDILARFWEAMGAVPVVVPWTEVKKALRTRQVDAVATHKAHVYPLGFSRYARFVTRLGDVSPALGVGLNESKYQALPPRLQADLSRACEAAGDYFTRCVQEAEAQNETLNIRKYRAVYLKVDLTPWRQTSERIIRQLVKEGRIREDILRDIQGTK